MLKTSDELPHLWETDINVWVNSDGLNHYQIKGERSRISCTAQPHKIWELTASEHWILYCWEFPVYLHRYISGTSVLTPPAWEIFRGCKIIVHEGQKLWKVCRLELARRLYTYLIAAYSMLLEPAKKFAFILGIQAGYHKLLLCPAHMLNTAAPGSSTLPGVPCRSTRLSDKCF